MDDKIIVYTNNHERDVMNWYDVPLQVQKDQFDYIKVDKVENGEEWPEFVKYKGWWYDLGDMERAPASLPKWDMIDTQTFFSGVLFRYAREEYKPEVLDTDYVICGSYYVGTPNWRKLPGFRHKRDGLSYLMSDGDFPVPNSRYGRNTADCAQVAWRLAYLYNRELNGSGMVTRDELDYAMSLVVNDRDDVAYMVRNYGNYQYYTK